MTAKMGGRGGPLLFMTVTIHIPPLLMLVSYEASLKIQFNLYLKSTHLEM